VTPGANPATATLTVSTTGRNGTVSGAALDGSAWIPPGLALLILVPAVALGAFSRRPLFRRRVRRWAPAALCVCLIMLMAGCTAHVPQAEEWTPVGTYRLLVQALSGQIVSETIVDLVVR
jgi:hypothetical protein